MLALLCSLIANVYSDKRRYSPSDFLPQWDAEQAGQSPEEMIGALSFALAKAAR